MQEPLSEKQEIAVAALLAGKTRRQAAKLANVNEVTIYRWLNGEAFREELRIRQARMFEQLTAQIYGLSEKAIATLSRNLKCGHPPTETRTALGILSHAERLRTDTLVARIEKLETLFSSEDFFYEGLEHFS